MCRWIIHAWRSWFHSHIHTSGWHPLPLHQHCNCIYRRTNNFYLRHIQWILEYHSTQSYRKSLSKFTTYIPGMVENKMAKTSISLNKPEGPMHSINEKNLRNKTFWNVLVWNTKTNIHHSKNDQKLLWQCCLLMALHELQIISCLWNIWHTHINTEYNLLWNKRCRILTLSLNIFQEGPKLNLLYINIIESEYGINIDKTYHIIKNIIQGYWTTNKNDVRFQKSPLPVDTSFENTLFMATTLTGEELKNRKLIWKIPQPLGWWNHACHCPKSLQSSIP